MNAEKFLASLGELDDKYYTEAVNYRAKSRVRIKLGAAAACFAIIAAFAVFALANHYGEKNGAPLINNSEIHISMNNVFFNETGAAEDVARVWYDPELYNTAVWGKAEIIDYYDKDLTPVYIPKGLFAAAANGTATIITDKNGKIIEDTVYLGFYHAYYEDGSPKLTDGVTAAVKGFSLAVSKVGLLSDCVYTPSEGGIKTTDINGVKVTFGYNSVPYYSDKHDPSGFYDMYTAEFEYNGIEYRLIAEQLTAEDVVKTVSSLIYGKEVTVDK